MKRYSLILLTLMGLASCADQSNPAFREAIGGGVVSAPMGSLHTASPIQGTNRFEMQARMSESFRGGAR